MYFVFKDLDKIFDGERRDLVWWDLRKLYVEKWLVKIVQAMYRNARSHVRVNETINDSFLGQVGLHQGSVLSPLSFITVLEALSIEIGSGFSEELLYADDLALVSKTLEDLKGGLEAWKGALESEGLKGKTKTIISSENDGKVTIEDKFPHAVCRKEEGSNSILWQFWTCWVHKKCSGI